MIILRTKHFGFYDQSGKLLEKYAKGGKFNSKFQKWKNNILEQYQGQLRSHGLNDKLSNKEIEDILREQSRARDNAANSIVKRRAEKLERSKKGMELAEKYRKEADAATDKSLKDYLTGLANDHESYAKERLRTRKEDAEYGYLSNLGKPGSIAMRNTGELNNRNRKFGPGQLLREEVENSTGYVEQNHLNSFYEKRKHEAFLKEQSQKKQQEEAIKNSNLYKNQQQATVDAQNANQKLQESLNNSNKQISDLTAKNQFLQQQQGIHAKNFNNEVNKNKDLTNKNKDLNSRYNESVEEIKRLHEKYNKDVEGLINSHKNSMSVVEKEKKELENSRNRWKYGAIAAGGLGITGTTAAAMAARSKDE